MQACWSLEPTRRPTFDQIGCFIQKELEVHKEQVRTSREEKGEDLNKLLSSHTTRLFPGNPLRNFRA